MSVSTVDSMEASPPAPSRRVRIYADSADLTLISQLGLVDHIAGFTTNPTLIRKAGITDYATFARQAIVAANGRPISLEVLSDTSRDIAREARIIHGWGENVYVKVPIRLTNGDSNAELLATLMREGVKINVTAVLAPNDIDIAVRTVAEAGGPAIVSVLAGRIADTGRDPRPYVKRAVEGLRDVPPANVLWASAREVHNVVQAEECACDIITLTPNLLAKLPGLGRELSEVAAETILSLHLDGIASARTTEW